MTTRIRLLGALRIWTNAVRGFRIWMHLGWRDIRTRFALTLLGPWWTTISILIFSVVLGVVYSSVFSIDLAAYLPFVASGLVTWYFVSGSLLESTNASYFYKSLLLNTRLSLVTMVLATIWRNAAVFLQSAPVVVAISLIGLRSASLDLFLVVPALFISSIALVSSGYLFAIAGNRYPALGVLLPSLLLLVFLSTPILWNPELVGERTWVYRYNPLYWMVSIVRQPLIFESPPAIAWIISISVAVGMFIVALFLTARLDRQVTLRL
jgi:lipopolysaccharide transport system permease protein